jgi:putative inorganic carbon (HCO3(-)) transporter
MAGALAAYALAPGLVPALVAGAVFLAMAYRQPRLGLAAVLATLPTYYFPRDFGGMAFSLPESALLLTAVATGLRALIRRDVAPRATGFDAWAALLLLAALLSLLPSEYLKLSLRALRTLVLEPVLFYYLAVALCPSLTSCRPLVAGFLGAATAVALLAVAQVGLNVETVQVEGVRRALGLYPSPNQLGLYLGRALPFAVALAIWVRPGRRVYLAISAAIALALLVTFSTGAWLGAAAEALVLAWLVGPRAVAAVLVAGGLVGAGGLLLLTRLGVERVLSGATWTFRRQIWASALAMVRDHPLTGIGLDNFLYRYQLRYILPEAWAEPNISHPHNWVLQFWLELGLLGLVAALGLLARFFWVAHRQLLASPHGERRALLAGAAASMVGWLVHGAGDNSYFLVDLSILFWWHLALVEIAARGDPACAKQQAG